MPWNPPVLQRSVTDLQDFFNGQLTLCPQLCSRISASHPGKTVFAENKKIEDATPSPPSMTISRAVVLAKKNLRLIKKASPPRSNSQMRVKVLKYAATGDV
jgi:hypothetical protein